jgi:pimeloyl-ACP methyl ester carboxylesterase
MMDRLMSTPCVESGLTMINGVQTELARGGSGQTVIFLHPGLGLFAAEPFLSLLAAQHDVVAPSHPGFGRSALPPWMSQIDDLAYFYLDLLQFFDLRDVILIGSSFGGWIAAEMAVKSTERVTHLVLVDALGIKISDRETRDIADIYGLSREEIEARCFVNPSNKPDSLKMTDDELAIWARNRESEALFGWSPYMHDPKLLHRLSRIQIPTTVLWGERDRIVDASYGRAFAGAIPGAIFGIIENAAHYPHIDQPHRLAREIFKAVPLTTQRQASA